MAITNAQQYKQLLANGGSTNDISLEEAKDMAPKGEFLAYINKKEAEMLKNAGGSGIMTNAGIPSFVEYGDGPGGYADAGTTAAAASTGSVQGDVDRGNQNRGNSNRSGNPPVITPKPKPPKTKKNTIPTSNFSDDFKVFAMKKEYERNLSPNRNYFGVPGALVQAFSPNELSFYEESDDDNDMSYYGMSEKDIVKSDRLAKAINKAEQTGSVTKDEFIDAFYGDNKPVLPKDESNEPIVFNDKTLPVMFDEDDDNNYYDSVGGNPFTNRTAYRLMADGGRADLAGGGMPYEGGIMDLESSRQMYGLGKLVKKVTKTVKKIAKSKVGKAAIIGAGIYGLGGGFSGGFKPGNLPGASFFGKGSLNPLKALSIGKDVMQSPFGSLVSSIGVPGAIVGASLIAGALTPQQEEEAKTFSDETGIPIEEIRANPNKYLARRFKADGGIMRLGYGEAGAVMNEKEMKKLSKSPLYKGFKMMYGVDPQQAKGNEAYEGKFAQFEQLYKKGFQEGGDVEPVAKKTMPLLDMDGQEMDLRDEGGFVPLGRMEKADDVPARLSKNEFVFTADAVRNAGEGDIDKGAEVMYNMMKNLESGGDVSEESQGLEGAREMFKTSQRLEEVL